MNDEQVTEIIPFERGPYVQVVAFCDRALREADGTLSLIRVVDVVTHTERGPNAPVEMPEFRCPLEMVLIFKSGAVRGRHEVTITPELPSGETFHPMVMEIRMEGEGRGVVIVSALDMPFRFEGLHWFHVRFDGRIITRLPLEVRYNRII